MADKSTSRSVNPGSARGREHNRTARRVPYPDDERNPFARDRDRVLYSSAFGRLAGVTQVVSPTEGHVLHNRLTHSLEVAQIGRRLTERLLRDTPPELVEHLGGLDPDVVETAGMAHDLGHPPFGHAAESELNRLAIDAEAVEGFEGNAQSFRILTRLSAHRFDYDGLNLTRASLNAVLKYPWPRDLEGSGDKYRKFGVYESDREAFNWVRHGEFAVTDVRSVEAEVMDFADGLAYSVHDLHDFIRAGLVDTVRLTYSGTAFQEFVVDWCRNTDVDGDAVRDNEDKLRNILSSFTEAPQENTYERHATLRLLTSRLIAQFINDARLQERDSKGVALYVDPSTRVQMGFLQRMVRTMVIENPRLATVQHGQREIVRRLFESYVTCLKRERSDIIPARFRYQLDNLPDREPSTLARVAIDVVASFTDAQAQTVCHRLTGVSPGLLTDPMQG